MRMKSILNCKQRFLPYRLVRKARSAQNLAYEIRQLFCSTRCHAPDLKSEIPKLLGISHAERNNPFLKLFWSDLCKFMSLCQSFLLEVRKTSTMARSQQSVSQISTSICSNFTFLSVFSISACTFLAAPILPDSCAAIMDYNFLVDACQMLWLSLQRSFRKKFSVAHLPTKYFFETSRKRRLYMLATLESCDDSFSRRLARMMPLDFFSRIQFLYCLASLKIAMVIPISCMPLSSLWFPPIAWLCLLNLGKRPLSLFHSVSLCFIYQELQAAFPSLYTYTTALSGLKLRTSTLRSNFGSFMQVGAQKDELRK